MKRVLLCALDWGLGHATRCVPVIWELQKQGAQVIIASSGQAGVLLRDEFGHLPYVELPGYNPSYQRNGSMMLKLLPQFPKFIRTVREEQSAVEATVKKHNIDTVIADNRYGCYSRKVKSVFITHQLNVRLPAGWALGAPLFNGLLHNYMRRFSEIWVPDQHGSGLTEPFLSTRIPFSYIGWLSRFRKQDGTQKKYDVMAIVSGPEPQRGIFESMLRKQFGNSSMRSLIVTGQPGIEMKTTAGPVEIVSHLNALEMGEAIQKSEIVIARGGYSSIMDLIALGKKAAFVPTPQQPEQIFLAKLLHRKEIAFSAEQENFVLQQAVEGARKTLGLSALSKEEGLLEQQIKKLLL